MSYIARILLVIFLLLSNIDNTYCFYNSSSYFDDDISSIRYNFSIDYNGGRPTVSALRVANNKVSISNPTRNGYKFSRYSYIKDGVTSYTSGRNIPIENINNKLLTANWSVVTYTISYTLNGGVCDEEMVYSYNVLSAPITLCKPYKYGFTFLGWSGSNGNNIEENVVIPTGSYGNKTYAATYRRDI